MQVFRTRQLLTILLAGSAVGLSACATSAPAGTEATPVGRYVVHSKTEHLDAVVGFRYAATHPGTQWLVLQFAATTPTGSSISIPRSGISVMTPDGGQVPMATQAQFTDAYGMLQPVVHQARIIRDPMGYFPPNREPCDLDFFSAPGRAVTYDELNLDYHRACAGLIYFGLPSPVAPGRYTLVIRPKEGPEVRIPFTL